jgi:hypothetical protein
MMYWMFSSPINLSDPDPQAVLGVLGSQDPTRWRLFRWAQGGYTEYPQTAERMAVIPGRSFWLISSYDVLICGLEGTSQCLTDPVVIRIESGWNQIACPFDFPVEWDAVTKPPTLSSPFLYSPDTDTGYEPATQLIPWEGYFVENLSGAPDSLIVPPVPTLVGSSPSNSQKSHPWTQGHGLSQDSDRWRVFFEVRSPASLRRFEVAVHPDASPKRDPFDVAMPPAPPTSSMVLSLRNDESVDPIVRMYRDVVPAVSDLARWNLSIAGPEAWGPLEFSASIDPLLPPDHRLFVIENATGVFEELVQGESAHFTRIPGAAASSESQREFTIIGGHREAVLASDAVREILSPAVTRITDVFPNPANPGAVVVFEIPRPGPTLISVYDAGGRLIRRQDLGHLETARHVMTWNGDNAEGSPVSSGVYFIRVESGGMSMTRRIVVVG